uniref:Uncharacterized protein n=1 Tax=Panagrolaimus sp. PS1159 TaxID=55785 RepID=A0AC35F3R8_9BILA
VELFDELLDKIWGLIRIHPLKEVQVLVLVRMLQARFPIYNRLAADSRLCRLIDPFLDYPPPAPSSTSSSVHSSDSTGNKKLVDMVVRERFTALKSAKVSSVNKVKAMKQKSEHGSLDQLRYYADCGHYEKYVVENCGHYEKYVVESGPAKAEFAAMRNRLRKCSRCVMKGKQV